MQDQINYMINGLFDDDNSNSLQKSTEIKINGQSPPNLLL